MPRSSTALSRRELLDLIWSKPATHLAKELGVSVTALIRFCDQAGVPRPTSGHWTKLEHGKAPPRPVLPPLPSGEVESIDLTAPIKRRTRGNTAEPQPSAPSLENPPPVEKWHPTVELTRAAYQSTGRDPKTDIVYPKSELAHIWIGSPNAAEGRELSPHGRLIDHFGNREWPTQRSAFRRRMRTYRWSTVLDRGRMRA